MSLSGADPRTNVQDLSAVQLPDLALAAAGVKYVVTTQRVMRSPVGRLGAYTVYEVPDPCRCAEFFDDATSTTRANVK